MKILEEETMKNYLTEKEQRYIHEHMDEAVRLLEQLGRIPAPSHHEEQRAAFVKRWLVDQGAEGVYVDEALNVIYPYGCTQDNDLAVVMAHMDIVFPDTEPLTLYTSEGRMFAPGIGDDTANLVLLLMCVKFVIENRPTSCHGILFVANACEEGLGNLKGTKAVMSAYGSRVKEFISFDGYMNGISDDSVGSHRYEITVRTEGGHSFANFGNDNAIYYLSNMIQTLYARKAPSKAKTTYNVGSISGGTTVNSIAQEASMLYEFRSVDRECLKEMEDFFSSVIETYRHMGIDVQVDVKGIRPCRGDVDADALIRLTGRNKAIVEHFTGEACKIDAGSTDANIPLSMGIPANTLGLIAGGRPHTREEWVDLGSMETGFRIALAVIKQYLSGR